MKADRSSIRYLVALWAGLDLAADGYSGKTQYFREMSYAAKAVRSFPLPPSIVVESGWGVHLYWLLKSITEVDDPQRIEKILSSLSDYFQCKRPIAIDSVLRLPDTFNPKHQPSVVQCTVKYLNGEFRYDLEDFEHLTLPGAERNTLPGMDQTPAESVVLQEDDDLGLTDQGFIGGEGVNGQNVGQFLDHELPDSRVVTPPQPASGAASHPAVLRPAVADRIPQSVNQPAVAVTVEEIDDAETVLVVAEGSTDSIADEIVEKVVHKLTGRLMEQMVDQIVEKLYQRITNSPKRQ
jgi:hypothetical protein